MFYEGFDIRAKLGNRTGHRRYQFTIDGQVAYETDDSVLYDALSGDETWWDDEDYKRAIDACEFILDNAHQYIIYLKHSLYDEFGNRHYYRDSNFALTDPLTYSTNEDDAKVFFEYAKAEELADMIESDLEYDGFDLREVYTEIYQIQ